MGDVIVKTSRSWIAILVVCAGMSPHASQGRELYGLLRVRDLTPFGILRLDMRPAYAIEIEPGEWALETELGYQNTWALSPNVENYLTSLEPQGRRDLGPAEIQAIQDLPGENYLLDTELAALDVTLHYKFSQHWTGYVIASALGYNGGFLDSTIESFHDTFGFNSYGRPAAKRNDVNLILDLKSTQTVLQESPTDGDFTDPTFGLRYVGIGLPSGWKLALEAAVKVPIWGRRLLISTGRTDVGFQASLLKFGDHHGFYLSASGVYYAGASEPARHDSQIIPTVVFGYERVLTERTNINLQGYASTSVYSHNQTDLQELLEDKYQLSLGFRHRRDHLLISFAVTENLQNVNNTPDIGFQFGLTYLP
jgi:Protein of unknown function (DUF3187)